MEVSYVSPQNYVPLLRSKSFFGTSSTSTLYYLSLNIFFDQYRNTAILPSAMGLFRKRPKPEKHVKRLVVGFILGAAISSIVGKKLLEIDEEKEAEPEDR